jgi:hypothetical protein
MQVDLGTNETWLSIVDDIPNLSLRWRETKRLQRWNDTDNANELVHGAWRADFAGTIHAQVTFIASRTDNPYTTRVTWDGHTRVFETGNARNLREAKDSAGLSVKLLLAEMIFEATRVPDPAPIMDAPSPVCEATQPYRPVSDTSMSVS